MKIISINCRYYLPQNQANKTPNTYSLKMVLPSDVTCTQCVLQWQYHTGKINKYNTRCDFSSYMPYLNQFRLDILTGQKVKRRYVIERGDKKYMYQRILIPAFWNLNITLNLNAFIMFYVVQLVTYNIQKLNSVWLRHIYIYINVLNLVHKFIKSWHKYYC